MIYWGRSSSTSYRLYNLTLFPFNKQFPLSVGGVSRLNSCETPEPEGPVIRRNGHEKADRRPSRISRSVRSLYPFGQLKNSLCRFWNLRSCSWCVCALILPTLLDTLLSLALITNPWQHLLASHSKSLLAPGNLSSKDFTNFALSCVNCWYYLMMKSLVLCSKNYHRLFSVAAPAIVPWIKIFPLVPKAPKAQADRNEFVTSKLCLMKGGTIRNLFLLI